MKARFVLLPRQDRVEAIDQGEPEEERAALEQQAEALTAALRRRDARVVVSPLDETLGASLVSWKG